MFSKRYILEKPVSRRSPKIEARELSDPDTFKADIYVKFAKMRFSEDRRFVYQYNGECILSKSYNRK